MELGCDGQSALDKAFNYVSLIRIEDTNYDLLFALQNLWAYSPITWSFKHVRGHQDDHDTIDNLDRWAKQNVGMDARAKTHLEVARRQSRHYMIKTEPWSMWVEGQKIISDLPMVIYDLVHSSDARGYWR